MFFLLTVLVCIITKNIFTKTKQQNYCTLKSSSLPKTYKNDK